MLKRIFIGLTVLVLILVGAVMILPGLVPTDTYRDKLEAELSRTLSRDVEITGDIKLSTFPTISIQTDGVSLSNPEGFTSETFMQVEGMSAKVRLIPLLSKQVEISGVEFDSPVISLERRADGKVNWDIGDSTEEKPKNVGPYKRDGRFTDYDPSLKLLRIKNGNITYKDDAAGQSHTISEVNLDLRAPSLSKPLKLNGDLTFDDLAVSLTGELESPADFLNGKATSFGAELKTQEANVGINGQFAASQNIEFTADFSADSQMPLTVAKRFDLPEDLKLPPLKSVSANGAINFDGKADFPKIDAKLVGEGFNAAYLGQLSLKDGLSGSGQMNAKLTDTSVVTPYLKEPIEALNAIDAVDVASDVNWAKSSYTLSNIIANVTGPDLTTSYSGNAKYAEALSLDGAFDVAAGDLPALLKRIGQDQPNAAIVKRVTAKGNVALAGKNVTLTNLVASTSEGAANGQFNGNATYNESLNLNGSFDAAVADLPKLLTLIGQNQPDAAALKRVSATGNIAMAGGKTTISGLSAKASEGLANGQYTGDISYDDALSLNGEIKADIQDLAALDSALEREIPYSDAVKRITFSSNISTVSDTYQLSGLSAKLEDGRLNGSFDGRLDIGDAPDLSGKLVISAASLRAIAVSQGIELPPNTDLGPIFENMNLSGQVSGTAEKITFTSGTIQLDKLSGNGDFTLLLAEAKPNLTGTLALGVMDLRPYMSAWSAQRPTGGILPWSTNSINLAGLNSANARIDITTPSIKTDRIELGQTDALLTLNNGTLTAKLNKSQLYDGTASGAFSISSATGRPALGIQTDIRGVAAQSFLAATGGFDKVSGLADFDFDIKGAGTSQADIMRNLNGNGTFKILQGKLNGIDAESLISGFDQALTNQQLPAGIGLGNSTDFEDLNGSFSVVNGVATLAGYKLTSGNLIMEGDGQIDLGNQTLDIGFRPKLQGGSNAAGFGVPLRFSGKFGQAKPGLDSAALTQLATARARDAASKALKDKLGDSALGNTLSGLVGGNTEGSTQNSGAGALNGLLNGNSSGSSQSGSSTDQLGNVIGGFLGGNNPTTVQPETNETESQPVPAPTPEQKAEDEIENALKGLFGKKKKDK